MSNPTIVVVNTPRPSYFVRHWRGELSLPLSYWINGWIATIAIIVAAEFATAFQPVDGTVAAAVVLSFTWASIIAATVWQVVGTWRSAGKHTSRGGTRFWAGAARLMIAITVVQTVPTIVKQGIPQVYEYWRIALGDPGIGAHELHVLRGGTELEFDGGLTFGVTDEIKTVLDANPAIRAIHLNSGGGRVVEARKLRDLIRQRGLVTYVATRCASACTIAYMGGVQRFISREGELGFHRGRSPGATESDLDATNAEDRQALIVMGVAAWFADHAYSTPADSMWWPTADELKRANVITGIASLTEFAVSGTSVPPIDDAIDKALLAVPLYAVIREVSPATYGKMRAVMADAPRKGWSEADTMTMVQSQFMPLLWEYVPLASDDDVLAMSHIAATKIEQLGAKNADACYGFLMPRPGDPLVPVAQYVSPDVIARELVVAVDVIRSAVASPHAVPSQQDVAVTLRAVMAQLVAEYGEGGVAALAHMDAPNADHAQTCRISAGLYEAIFSLPANEQSPLLRYMYSANKKT